jgi:hypothetical protein
MIAHVAFDLTAYAMIYWNWKTAVAHSSSNDLAVARWAHRLEIDGGARAAPRVPPCDSSELAAPGDRGGDLSPEELTLLRVR